MGFVDSQLLSTVITFYIPFSFIVKNTTKIFDVDDKENIGTNNKRLKLDNLESITGLKSKNEGLTIQVYILRQEKSQWIKYFEWIIKNIQNPNVTEIANKIVGWTPLHEAAKCGYLQVFKMIMNETKSINPKDKRGRTPLHEAASKGNYPQWPEEELNKSVTLVN